MAFILVVDDEPGIRELLRAVLRGDGHRVKVVASGKDALVVFAKEAIDLVITDLSMPGMSGTELLRQASEISPDTPGIVMTAFGSKESAIEAMRHGAVNYLEKPFDVEEMRLHVRRALAGRRLSNENRRLRARLSAESDLLGRSQIMSEVRALVERVAPTDSSVLITGESGTGKEIAARAIHAASTRAEGPFVGVNCGAIPAELLESELFGHVKGAFTGADRSRRGLVETAEAGTLFLDEIGDMPLEMQIKLLRILQERRIRRVGGIDEIPVNVRIVTATHQDLESYIKDGRFREDLYYRINVIRIQMPALRDRAEDIPEFVRHFAQRFAERMGREMPTVTPGFLTPLTSHRWPGNVRELENVIERAVALSTGERLQAESLPEEILGAEFLPQAAIDLGEGFDLEQHMEGERRRFMAAALRAAGGVQTKAAHQLGMTFRSFRYFAKKYALTGKGGEGGAAAEEVLEELEGPVKTGPEI